MEVMNEMKKINIFIMFILLTSIILSACGGTSSSNTSITSTDTDSTTSEKKYVLKTAYAYPSTSTPGNYFSWFNEELQKRSDGRLSLEIYSDAQLMPAAQEIPAMLSGEIDMSLIDNGTLSTFLPEYYVFDIPMLFDHDAKDIDVHIQDMRKFYANENGGKLIERKMEEKGLKIISKPVTTEPAVLLTAKSDNVISSVESIKGLKMRIIGGQILPKLLNSMGASGVPIPAAELNTALQQGVVDGVLTPATYAMDVKLPVKTASLFPMSTQACPIIISNKAFDSLPADLQEILIEVGKDMENYSDEYMKERYPKVLNEFKAAGVKAYFPTKEESAQWKEATSIVVTDFKNTVKDGQKLIDAAEAE